MLSALPHIATTCKKYYSSQHLIY